MPFGHALNLVTFINIGGLFMEKQIKNCYEDFKPFLNTRLGLYPGIFIIVLLLSIGFSLGSRLVDEVFRFLGW
jgi:energy-converting hydrogenase Eha subunit E